MYFVLNNEKDNLEHFDAKSNVAIFLNNLTNKKEVFIDDDAGSLEEEI